MCPRNKGFGWFWCLKPISLHKKCIYKCMLSHIGTRCMLSHIGFEGGQTAGLNALKNRWLGRVAARVAVERPAGGLEG